MTKEEALDILNNIIADEVIGTYCIEIQKEVDCSKNCKNEDCYLIQAIEKVSNLIQEHDTEINKLNKRISDLEFALIEMVYQFADESKNQLNTMGLSALETAFCELDFDNPIDKDIVIKKFAELQKKYYE